MRTIIFIFLSNIFFLLYAQKEGSKWALGNGTGTNMLTLMEFQQDTILQNAQNNYAGTEVTSATISHPITGQFLFYSNGVRVSNQLGVLTNGYNLSPCAYSTQHPNGLRVPQGVLILPMPNNLQKYYVFHETIAYGSGYGYADTLQYSIVDYSQNPNGIITKKNTNLLAGMFAPGEVTSCRHANGRDWWILYPYFMANKYYEYLLKPDGLHGPYEIKTNENFGSLDATGYAVFSPDGKKYARYDAYLENKLYLYDFDRCSGNLTNGQWIDLTPYKSKYRIGGIAFSPNSRYLYLNWDKQLYQFDVNNNPVTAPVLVANYDNYCDTFYTTPIQTLFGFPELAPNGKIYISTNSGVKYLHVIHSPDSAGLACDFRQHDFRLINWNASITLPNMPDFNLGADSTYCDSTLSLHLSNQLAVNSKQVQIYPNPVEKELSIALQNVQEKTTFVLYDALGKVVLQQAILQGVEVAKINVAYLPKGMYFYLLKEEQGIISQGKIIKE